MKVTFTRGLSVCVSVCVLAASWKTTDWINMKILQETVDKKKLITLRYREFFHTLAHIYSLEKSIGYSIITHVSLDK